jgi:hypothetical protein
MWQEGATGESQSAVWMQEIMCPAWPLYSHREGPGQPLVRHCPAQLSSTVLLAPDSFGTLSVSCSIVSQVLCDRRGGNIPWPLKIYARTA